MSRIPIGPIRWSAPNGDATIPPEKNKASMLAFIISETGFFGVLILAYLFYNATPQPGPAAHDLNLLKTAILQPLPVREQLHDLAFGGQPAPARTAR